eukprot:Nk52_evm89s158 gene=Nk52_evmTU89s158
MVQQSAEDAAAALFSDDVEMQNSPGMQEKPFDHPLVVFFHCLFRVLAILWYIICEWISDNFVMNFITIVLLLSFDFWTVKNVSGRLLVGMRWWNYIREEDGGSEWIFESKDMMNNTSQQNSNAMSSNNNTNTGTNPAESRVFWLTLYIAPAVWGFFAFWALIGGKFIWLSVTIVGLVLNGANVIGYRKCYQTSRHYVRDQQQKGGSVEGGLQGYAASLLTKSFMDSARTRFDSFTGGGGGGSSGSS